MKEYNQVQLKPLEGQMAFAKAGEYLKKFSQCMDILNEIIVVFPNFQYGLIEKAKLLMTIGDHEQSYELYSKIQQ